MFVLLFAVLFSTGSGEKLVNVSEPANYEDTLLSEGRKGHSLLLISHLAVSRSDQRCPLEATHLLAQVYNIVAFNKEKTMPVYYTLLRKIRDEIQLRRKCVLMVQEIPSAFPNISKKSRV
jgi:hypothetical protein